MLPTPRIVVIDDEIKHLEGLTRGLNKFGYACLPILYPGQLVTGSNCPYVRIIFTDLHIVGGPISNFISDFAAIGGLIENEIKPSGPYLIILWTEHPEQEQEFQDYLTSHLKNVAKPFAVIALSKAEHLDSTNRNISDPNSLIFEIRKIIEAQPQVAALLDWERAAQNSVAETVSSLSELANFEPKELSKLLNKLAAAAVGAKNFPDDIFAAVNEALLPILADRVAYMGSQDSNGGLWQKALYQHNITGTLDCDIVAKLNSLVHLEVLKYEKPTNWQKRGAVVPLPKRFSESNFKRTFGLTQNDIAEKSFFCKNFEENKDKTSWVLVQTQPACDYAQNRPGTLPFNLGLYLHSELVRRNAKPPESLWCSPPFWVENVTFKFHINATYQVSLPPHARNIDFPKFRLREQILNELIYRIHSYGARPGSISFRNN